METSKEILRIENLSKDFYIHNGGKSIKSCQYISFSLIKGEFIGIVGLSGAGKSTILKCINRTYLPTQGNIYYASQALGRINLTTATEREILYLRKNEIGYVSQFLSVMPRTTAKEHVRNALLEMGCDALAAEAKAAEMLAYFKLPENLWDIYPNTFSGGERLRLNLAHAMIKRPSLLLLDEPTAALDNKTKLLVKDMLKMLKDNQTTMIGIFHDLAFMEGMCDRVFNISEGELEC
jgi:alpha-D-ribose 1-methylphosphonate 5-triphosphate synthase subunit PhnL